jgi:2-polyprenyl-3-methyl-5-hydroxy-6-metoxy-1,4-benzoquinol methylase
MANARNKTVDKTFLSVDKAEERGFIHRDYIAHCLRWSHVIKRMGERHAYKEARVLDIGCGRELPLAKTLYSSKYIVQQYFGVDVGPILDTAISAFSSGKFPIKVWENVDVCDIATEDLDEGPHDIDYWAKRAPNWATMFEVAEHVEPAHLIKMLRHIKSLCASDVKFFVSTPCWNRTDCAANHVNEMTYEAFGALLEGCGWYVENVYGTFASIRDYEHLLDRAQEPNLEVPSIEVFNRLREYYDTNFLSCVFAPLFPAQSRNCLWELRKWPAKGAKNKFPTMADCQQPWGSSDKWQEMGDIQ